MYKLLVTDFDGTLLDSDGAIPLSTMVEIDRIRKKGCLFTISTDRVLNSVLDYNRDFPFIDYIIFANGAYVYDVEKKKAIFKKNILPSILKKIKKMYGEYDICFCTSNCRYLLVSNKSESINLEGKEELIKDFNSFYDDNKNSVYKVEILFNNRKVRDSVYNEILELKLKICINKFIYNKTICGIDITMVDIDKFAGVKKICEKNKLSPSEVIAIGSLDSDISMIKNVGMGVSVSNASKKLKSISNMKTSSNDNKGVEKVMKKLL